ncbi:MAG: hypothetical protein JJ992_15750 [Planctomycetes bacterium]|nr:hypothetical protein [Planctomycetota bacterium]
MKYVLLVAVAVFASVPSLCDAEDSANSDQIRVAVQAICPVSGQQLGAHGDPVKAKIGDEVVFLCCQGCLGGKVKPEHWATIHENFAKAQGICPVMKKELPQNPKWTFVEGRIVYVCCPPCADKVKADPTAVLKTVDDRYVAYLKATQNRNR